MTHLVKPFVGAGGVIVYLDLMFEIYFYFRQMEHYGAI
jgi:hypothetical protein